jgi:hypothetical protein
VRSRVDTAPATIGHDRFSDDHRTRVQSGRANKRDQRHAGARANPGAFAKTTLKQTADHLTEIITALDRRPAVIGHSTGGPDGADARGPALSAATVAIDPGVFRGVLPLPFSVLRGVGPYLLNPLTRGRAITSWLKQFKYGWANGLDEKEARELYDT